MTNWKKSIIPYIFVTGLGVLLHFAYEWSGENAVVGLFSAVNESTWEHLKLIFFPMLLLALWNLSTSHKDDENFLPARTLGILAAMTLTVIAFYTYTGVLGSSIDFINIAIYFLAVAFGFWVERKIYGKTRNLTSQISAAILILIAFLFFISTYSPPAIGIFQPQP